MYDSNHPFGGRLPCDLEVGEKMDFTFAPEDCMWLAEGYTHIGINDSFATTHWCKKQQVADAKEKFHAKAWVILDPWVSTELVPPVGSLSSVASDAFPLTWRRLLEGHQNEATLH